MSTHIYTLALNLAVRLIQTWTFYIQFTQRSVRKPLSTAWWLLCHYFYLQINLSRLIDIDESELKHKIHLFICIRCSEFGFHCLSPHNTSTHHNSAKSLKLCANDTRAPYSINTHSICWRTRTLFDVGKKWMKCMCGVKYTVHFYVCECSECSVGHRIPTQRLILLLIIKYV